VGQLKNRSKCGLDCSLDSNEFLSKSRRARINFHSNLTIFQADGSITITGKKMAVETVT
jgi:hypothetical protein